MASSVQIAVLIGVLAAGVFGSAALAIVFVRSVLHRARERLDAELAGQPILLRDDMANFFGLASQGAVQMRGNGSLALTRDTLTFVLALSKRPPLSIPRSAIQKVESTRSHLGRSVFRPLLTVHFVTPTGETDVVAWLVRDLDRWLAQLGGR